MCGVVSSTGSLTGPGIKGWKREKHHSQLIVITSDPLGKKKKKKEKLSGSFKLMSCWSNICLNSNMRNISTKTHINDSIELEGKTATLPLCAIYSPDWTKKGVTVGVGWLILITVIKKSGIVRMNTDYRECWTNSSQWM